MRCEVVAIGTELLLGQIVDTNSSWIGEQLALAGIDSLFQTKVGDNLGRMVDTLELALSRSDAVICCGGLGPTQDDITRQAIAQVMGVGLELDDAIAARIEEMFTSRGRRMPMNNLLQAEVPEGATAIVDPLPGTAPGLICPVVRDGQEKVIYAVPGVPREMQILIAQAVLPDLMERAGERATIYSRTLRTWGESESGLAERLAGRIAELDRIGNPTLAYNASGIEGIKVRITAKAADLAAAETLVAAEEAKLRGLLGDLVFGVDGESIEAAVLRELKARGLTLGLAESLTGGLMASRVVDVPGSSEVFRGGIVSYASEVKYDVLQVRRGPVVCLEAAAAMAEGARRVLGADVGLAVTGVAGPEPQEDQPPGTVFVGIDLGPAGGDRGPEAFHVPLFGDRQQIRQFTAITAMNALRLRLLALSAP